MARIVPHLKIINIACNSKNSPNKFNGRRQLPISLSLFHVYKSNDIEATKLKITNLSGKVVKMNFANPVH